MELSLTCAVFGLAAFSVLWKEADAVECYQCCSYEEGDCGLNGCLNSRPKPIDGPVPKPCWPSTEDTCSGGEVKHACNCTTVKCNGVESHTAYKLMFVVASAFLVLLKQMLF